MTVHWIGDLLAPRQPTWNELTPHRKVWRVLKRVTRTAFWSGLLLAFLIPWWIGFIQIASWAVVWAVAKAFGVAL